MSVLFIISVIVLWCWCVSSDVYMKWKELVWLCAILSFYDRRGKRQFCHFCLLHKPNPNIRLASPGRRHLYLIMLHFCCGGHLKLLHLWRNEDRNFDCSTSPLCCTSCSPSKHLGRPCTVSPARCENIPSVFEGSGEQQEGIGGAG